MHEEQSFGFEENLGKGQVSTGDLLFEDAINECHHRVETRIASLGDQRPTIQQLDKRGTCRWYLPTWSGQEVLEKLIEMDAQAIVGGQGQFG